MATGESSTVRPPLLWSLRDSETVYVGFSWHSVKVNVVNEAKGRFSAMMTQRGKSCVEWHGLVPVRDGFYLPWKAPATFNAGYCWFNRKVGDLVWESGMSPNWCVVPHAVRYEEASWLQALEHHRASADGTVSGASPRASASIASSTAQPSAASCPSYGCVPDENFWLRRGLLLKVLGGIKVLKEHAEEYKIGKKIGEGTFAKVYAATRRTQPKQKIVLKAAKEKEERIPFLKEASLLCGCMGHPSVVQLLDVVHVDDPNRPREVALGRCLVFESWGTDLSQSLPRFQKQPRFVREILRQVAAGTAHIHSLGAIHGDLKPSNILIKVASGQRVAPTPILICKVADLGSCVAANPRHREKFPDDRLRARGVPLTTLPYRAPELLCGMQDFSLKVVSFWMLFCRGLTLGWVGGFWLRKGSGTVLYCTVRIVLS